MQKNLKQKLIDYLFLILGNVIFAVGLVAFLEPANISPGGFTGIASLINYTLGLKTGIVLLLLNVPVIIIGYIKFGGGMILRTLISAVISSVAIDTIAAFTPKITDDKIIASLAGGVFMGTGMAFVLLHGATTGGTDILAKLICKKLPFIPFGRVILITDAIVLTLAAIVYKNIETALYSVLTILVSTNIIDRFLYTSSAGKMAFIITTDPEEIKEKIYKTLGRGVTQIKTIGGYSGEEKTLIICALRRSQLGQFYRIVREISSDDFVMLADLGEIFGNGFNSRV